MKYYDFFQNTVPQLVNNLNEEHQPAFGLMTPQHMLEHLIWVTKATAKDFGPAPEELTKGQLGFMKFLQNGAHFEYRPSDKTAADLPALKYDSLEETKAVIPEAIKRLHNFVKDREEKLFSPMMGHITPDELLLFHYQHYKWHLEKQFGLAEGAQ